MSVSHDDDVFDGEGEKIDVPQGAYLSFGPRPGQKVRGLVEGYDPVGGTTAAAKICPQLELKLVDSAVSINGEGDRTEFEAGERVVINCAQTSLKRGVLKGDPEIGDGILIEYIDLVATNAGKAKIFDVTVYRKNKRRPVDLDDFDRNQPPPF